MTASRSFLSSLTLLLAPGRESEEHAERRAVIAIADNDRGRDWLNGIVELLIVAFAYLFYTAARNLIRPDAAAAAFANATDIIRVEKALGIFVELHIQSWLLDSLAAGLVVLTYLYTHGFWFALIGSALFFFISRPSLYYELRRIFLVTLCAGILLFVVFPVAPPRLLGQLGFTDAMRLFGVPILAEEGSVFTYNKFAAMPSLHYTWTLLIVLGWRRFGHRVAFRAALLFQALILLAIIATANHYILDAVFGALLFAIAVRIASVIGRFHLRDVLSAWINFVADTLVALPERRPHARYAPYAFPKRLDPWSHAALMDESGLGWRGNVSL